MSNRSVGWLLVVGTLGGYRNDVFGAGTDEYKRVLNASVFGKARDR